MKTLRYVRLLPAALVLIATITGAASARLRETVNQVYDTDSTPRLNIRNINGDLNIASWDQKKIEVTAVKSADAQDDLERVEIRARMDDGYLRIDVKYGDDEWSDGRDMPSVDLSINVPRGTRIDDVELINGDISIRDVRGDVDASSVNGAVEGERLGGDVALSAVNGTVSLQATSDVKSIRLNSVNGGVVLVLPKKFDANIQAGTVHGSIHAVQGLDVDATTFSGSSMQGTIGKGGLKVDLNTVNGSIEIRHEGDREAREEE